MCRPAGVAGSRARSRARRRKRADHADARSATQRLGRRRKPRLASHHATPRGWCHAWRQPGLAGRRYGLDRPWARSVSWTTPAGVAIAERSSALAGVPCSAGSWPPSALLPPLRGIGLFSPSVPTAKCSLAPCVRLHRSWAAPGQARHGAQVVHRHLETACTQPASGPVVDHVPRQLCRHHAVGSMPCIDGAQVVGQRAPSHAMTDQVAQPVEHLPQRMPALPGILRQQGRAGPCQRPFVAGHGRPHRPARWHPSPTSTPADPEQTLGHADASLPVWRAPCPLGQ